MNVVPVIFPGGATIIPYGWGKSLYFPLDIRGLCYNIDFKDDILKKRKEIEEQKPLKFRNKRAEKRYYKKQLKKEFKNTSKQKYYEINPLFSDD